MYLVLYTDLNGDKKLDLVYTGTNQVRYVLRQ